MPKIETHDPWQSKSKEKRIEERKRREANLGKPGALTAPSANAPKKGDVPIETMRRERDTFIRRIVVESAALVEDKSLQLGKGRRKRLARWIVVSLMKCKYPDSSALVLGRAIRLKEEDQVKKSFQGLAREIRLNPLLRSRAEDLARRHEVACHFETLMEIYDDVVSAPTAPVE